MLTGAFTDLGEDSPFAKVKKDDFPSSLFIVGEATTKDKPKIERVNANFSFLLKFIEVSVIIVWFMPENGLKFK